MIVNMNFGVAGREEPRTPGQAPLAGFRTISPDYFAVMGMRMVEGRAFADTDRSGSARVVIVNQTLAQRYWPGTSPIGSRVLVERDDATVVGVVNDVRHAGPAAAPDAELYLPFLQAPARAAWVVARSDQEAGAIPAALRAVVASVDRNLPLAQVTPLTVLLGRNLAQARFITALLSGFAVVATILAIVGIYSVLSLVVRRRTREIGVRMALGASRAAVIAMVLRRSLLLAGGGVITGAALGAGLSRFLGTLLFEVRPGDPITILGMAVLIILAAIAASLAPARRASLIDPIAALRED
jgi:putative ABC transport system permease protein